ncbi:MAG TPA: hypothetical protein VGK23_06095 [Methanomassiliicoccales archaeon]|jgi:hypothetical protein
MVDEEGRSDPNRDIYRVLDDDYVPVKDRLAPAEDEQIDPHNFQARVPVGGTDAHDISRSRGSGRKAWAVACVFLVVCLIISAGIVSGWFKINNGGLNGEASTKEIAVGDFDSVFPDNGSVIKTDDIQLIWTPAENAKMYEIMLDTGPTFMHPITAQTDGNCYRMNLTDGTYYWKVGAGGAGSPSNWTSVKSFLKITALGTTGLISPLNDSLVTNTDLSFLWSAVDHAALYRLQVDSDRDFSSPVIDTLTNGTNYPINYQYQNGETYSWRVMSTNGELESEWTAARSFHVNIRLPAPSLTGPDDDAMITADNLTLNWTDVNGAYVYRLQVDRSSNFSSPAIDVLTLSSEYRATDLQDNVTYHWRVMASNDHYHSPWSTTSGFFKGFDHLLRSYSWNYGGHGFHLNLSISGPAYYAQKNENGQPLNLLYPNFAAHVNSSSDFVRQAASEIKKYAASLGYNQEQTLNLAMAFVQSIPYGLDLNTTGHVEYLRYPVETLVDGVGDCDCTSILLLSLIQTPELGYDGVLLEYDGSNGDSGHMAVGVAGQFSGMYHTYTYYTFLGVKYYYCESTSEGYLAGMIPDEISSKWNSAKIIQV